jgi:hypothetical protein
MSSAFSPIQNFAGKQVQGMKFVDLTKAGDNGLITGVKVLWNNYIVGVELLFNGQSAGLIKGNVNQFWEENFSLQQGDFIVEVYGRSGNVINCFGFRTAKGMTKTWGNPCEGDSFSFKMDRNYIKSLKFGVTDYVNYLEPVYEDIMFAGAIRLPFSQNGKFTEQLGKMRNNSEGFEDWDWISNKFNYTVAEIKIWHNGTYVYGVQFLYGLDGTKKTPGKHCAEANGLKCESLILNEGEHITKILCRSGHWVDFLGFFTDQGRVLAAGGNGGGCHLTVVPDGHQFVAVGGSTGTYLDTIQFFYDEIY